jgi:hypothetical protein
MSELRSTIESLRAEELRELPDVRIEDDFAELQYASEAIEVERLRRLAELDRRGIFQRDGHLSTASWLARTFRLAWGHAREQVRLARALQEMPETRHAVEEGEISFSAVRLLVSARDAEPEAFRRSEPQLVEAARRHSGRTSSASPPSGDSAPSESDPSTPRSASANAGRFTPRSRSSGWCEWTETSTPRPGRTS